MRKMTTHRRALWNQLAQVERSLQESLQAGDLRSARPTAARVHHLLAALPQVVETDRGQKLLAWAAEARRDWKSAVRHRRLQIAHMAFMRELAATEKPLARRAILREFSKSRMAAAYRDLARVYDRTGSRRDATVARREAHRWEAEGNAELRRPNKTPRNKNRRSGTRATRMTKPAI
jgi:hypothetical protein